MLDHCARPLPHRNLEERERTQITAFSSTRINSSLNTITHHRTRDILTSLAPLNNNSLIEKRVKKPEIISRFHPTILKYSIQNTHLILRMQEIVSKRYGPSAPSQRTVKTLRKEEDHDVTRLPAWSDKRGKPKSDVPAYWPLHWKRNCDRGSCDVRRVDALIPLR